jgi:tetratricopeptide (TPR) repeat protein
MKKLNLLTSFLIAVFLLSSCGGLDKMKEEYGTLKFESTPKVLEMHGGEVEYSITGNIPPEWFNKKAIVEWTPVLTYEGGEKTFKAKKFQGEKVEANNKVIKYETGGDIEFNGSFEYNKDMRVSDLVVRGEAKIDDETLPMPAQNVAKGIKATPNLVMVDPKPVMAADKFVRVTTHEKDADIHYEIERDNLRNSELTQEDIKNLESFVKDVEKAENKNYKGVQLSAYASPDGPMDLNERLSKGRKKSANKFIEDLIGDKKLSKEDAKKIFEAKTTTEDWEGFKKLVENSDIEDKDLILRVLSMHSDPEVREKEIENMAETWKVLAEKILPKLRRSELAVKIEQVGFSDEEIKKFVDSKPDTLNKEELLYAGYQLYTDLDQRLKAFELAAEKDPKCMRAYNNIGYVKIKKGELDDAREALEKANELKEGNPKVLNNLGVIELEKGNVKEAKEYFLDATDAGKAVKYNLGIINIKNGEYETAISYLQNYNSFNTALALMLGGKPGEAEKMISSLDDDKAMNYYLKAVIAARNNNETEVFNNLRTAVGKDAELKKMAKTDMEFVDYLENSTFKSIVGAAAQQEETTEE